MNGTNSFSFYEDVRPAERLAGSHTKKQRVSLAEMRQATGDCWRGRARMGIAVVKRMAVEVESGGGRMEDDGRGQLVGIEEVTAEARYAVGRREEKRLKGGRVWLGLCSKGVSAWLSAGRSASLPCRRQEPDRPQPGRGEGIGLVRLG